MRSRRAPVRRSRDDLAPQGRNIITKSAACVVGAEAEIDHDTGSLDRPSMINCDGPRTVAQSTLTQQVGNVDQATLTQVCAAVGYALER